MKTLYSLLFTICLVGLSFTTKAQDSEDKVLQKTISGGAKGKTYKVTFKNESGKDMYVAVAYYDKNPSTMGGRCFYTKGWFKVNKGKSIWTNVSGRRFYYHAHQIGKQNVSIGSEKEFYAHRIKKFNLKKADNEYMYGKKKDYKLYKFDKIPASNQVTLK
ncbi:MAG TPA: hypothetical protein DCS93_35625 [Microscillaceae bacterium]|nr:hypothetical protein [Microscillaceae bacterium]